MTTRPSRTKTACVVLALLAGCGDDPTEGPAGPDAAPAADNGVHTCGKPLVYLNFTGATIVQGATDDATRDQSSQFGFTAEPVSDASFVSTVEGDVFARLAELGIPATRTRPPTGDYLMVVFDDDASDWPTDPYPLSISPWDCGDVNPRNLNLIDVAGHRQLFSTQQVDHSVLYGVGISAGLDIVTAAADPNNCMVVSRLLAECRFTGEVATNGQHCRSTRQDQRALLVDAYGCPP